MPHDMFGDLVSRQPSIRSRRTPLLVASIITHSLAIAAAIVLSLVATDVLPSPHEALAFYDTSVRLADIPLPPPPPRAPVPAQQPAAPVVNPNAAPLVAPQGFTRESGLEDFATTAPDIGVVIGSGGALTETRLELPPPPPPPAPPEPVRLHSGIQAPVKTVNLAPVYPPMALAARIQGIVIIETTIDEDGRVLRATALRGHPTLQAAALDAVSQWRFTPARLNGQAIPVIMTVTVEFKLR